MIDSFSLIWPAYEPPEKTCERFRRMGFGYEPTEDEIQRKIADLICTSLRCDPEYPVHDAEIRLRPYAIRQVMYRYICNELERRNARRMKLLSQHYAERDAGRESFRPSDLLPVFDAARRVGVTPEKVHYWIRNRDIRVWGNPKHYRVSLAELTEYAAEVEVA